MSSDTEENGFNYTVDNILRNTLVRFTRVSFKSFSEHQ